MASPWDALPGVVLDKGKGPGTGTTFLRVAVERILGLTVLLVVGATVFNTTISLGIGEAMGEAMGDDTCDGLQITIDHGEDLKSADWFSRSGPYLEITPELKLDLINSILYLLPLPGSFTPGVSCPPPP